MKANAINAGPVAAPRHPADYRRVYVWELPVRVYHWINAVCLVGLIVTGYLIGAPLRPFYAAEAYQLYWFGTVRFVHFICAFVYVFNFSARIYWGFVGNKYASWKTFFPLKPSQRQEIVDVVKADVHVYLSFYHDYIEGRGTISSIVGGWKFEREKRAK